MSTHNSHDTSFSHETNFNNQYTYITQQAAPAPVVVKSYVAAAPAPGHSNQGYTASNAPQFQSKIQTQEAQQQQPSPSSGNQAITRAYLLKMMEQSKVTSDLSFELAMKLLKQ